jgi:hypothetical protein
MIGFGGYSRIDVVDVVVVVVVVVVAAVIFLLKLLCCLACILIHFVVTYMAGFVYVHVRYSCAFSMHAFTGQRCGL